MVLTNRQVDASSISRLLGILAIVLAGLAAVVLLFPRPLADAFFAAWVLFAIVIAIVGTLGAWTHRTALVWVAAMVLLGLTVVGMWSIGLFVAPAAIAMLGSAVASSWTGPRPGAHDSIREDPPSVLEAVLKTVAGAILVVVGAVLTYQGTIVQELFTRGCASETLACALEVTRWSAVGLSVLGLVAICVGGWLIWTQITVGRVLASAQAG